MKFRIWFWIAIAAIFLIRVFSIEQTITKALYDFDEARYAEVARNTLITGSWIIPIAGGPDEPRTTIIAHTPVGDPLFPYLWKPPFHTWIISAVYLIGGINEFSVRVPSVLAGFGICGLVFFLSRKLFPEEPLVAYGSTLFMVSSTDFSFVTNQGTTDALLLFFSLLSISLIFSKNRWALFIAGAAWGLALMTKSFAAYWVPVVAAACIALQMKEFSLRDFGKQLAMYLAAATLIALPWHIFMYAQFGALFIERYVFANTFARAAGNVPNKAPLLWYGIYMLDQWKPFVFVLPLVIGALLQSIVAQKLSQKIDQRLAFLIGWIALIIIPFSLAESKVWWYIFPMWVPVSILLAYGIVAVIKKAFEQSHGVKITLIVAAVTIFSLLPYWQLSPHHIPMIPFAVCAVLLCGMGFMVIKWSHQKNKIRADQSSKSHCAIVSVFFLIFTISFINSIKESQKRDDFNQPVKQVLMRHAPLHQFAVIGMPYESPLFYSQASYIETDPQKASYILMRKEPRNGLFLENFHVIDQEKDIILMERR